jgi:hypothetical protein
MRGETNRRSICIHARGRLTAEEVRFWEDLRSALNRGGIELYLIVHHLPQIPSDLPVIQVPNGLESFWHLIQSTGWVEDDNSPPIPQEEFLLERESSFRQAPQDSWRGALRRRALRFARDFYSTAQTRSRPDLMLIWNGQHAQELLFSNLCKSCGCPVEYIERGPFPGTIQVDAEGILGGSSVARITDWRWSSEASRRASSVQYERLVEFYRLGGKTWWEQPQNQEPEALRRKLGIDPLALVILFAAQVDADTQNILFSPLFKENLDALQWLAARLKERPGVFLLGKHHPKRPVSPDECRKIVGNAGTWTTDVSLFDALQLADRVAAVNSTVLYEGLIAGKPALSMGRSLLSGKCISYEMQDRHAGVDVLDSWIEGRGDAERQNRWRDFAAYLLAEHLYAFTVQVPDLGLKGPAQLAQALEARIPEAGQADYAHLQASPALADYFQTFGSSRQ